LGNKVAFGAPDFLGIGDSDPAVGEDSGVAVGDGVALGDVNVGDVPVGSGIGELFFLRCGGVLEVGLGLGDGDEVSTGLAVGEGFFFRCGDEVGDALVFFLAVAVGDGVVFGVGVGVGDFFFAAPAFFFRCGVGVGVAKIFFSVCPREGSAASFTVAANVTHVSQMKIRRSISNWLDGEA
jgi:hypothetical protein